MTTICVSGKTDKNSALNRESSSRRTIDTSVRARFYVPTMLTNCPLRIAANSLNLSQRRFWKFVICAPSNCQTICFLSVGLFNARRSPGVSLGMHVHSHFCGAAFCLQRSLRVRIFPSSFLPCPFYPLQCLLKYSSGKKITFLDGFVSFLSDLAILVIFIDDLSDHRVLPKCFQ